MFANLKAGWRLARLVRKSVSKDRGVFLYPILSGIISVGVFAFTFASLYVTIPLNFSGNSIFIYIGALLLAYIAVGFLSTIILLAMLIAYRAHNSGNPVSLRTALGTAWSYRKQALEWAIFYTLLMVLLRIIESRFRGIGQFVIGAIGSMMIAIATFFAIPSILDNRSGPIDAVKNSVATIKNHFGQTFGGVAYVDLYTLIFTLSGVFAFIGGFLLISAAIPVFVLAILIIAGIMLIVLGVILNYTYLNIVKLVLFDYVNGKGLPEGINEDDVKSAIKRKKSSSRYGKDTSSQQDNF